MRVIHETTPPGVVVQSRHGDSGGWGTDCGFATAQEAIEYANERQGYWPDMRFRVVDLGVEG